MPCLGRGRTRASLHAGSELTGGPSCILAGGIHANPRRGSHASSPGRAGGGGGVMELASVSALTQVSCSEEEEEVGGEKPPAVTVQFNSK